jgi:multiple sugar transport system permease protein
MTANSINSVKSKPTSPSVALVKHWIFRTGIDPITWIVRLFMILILLVFFIVPLLWLFTATTKTNQQLFDLPWYSLGSLSYISKAWGYLMQFNHGILTRWIYNSFDYAILGLLLSIGFAIPAGFTLAVIPFKLRKPILWVTLLVMLIPVDALVLPMYLELFYMHLIDTPWALIVPTAAYPIGVYLAFQYYKLNLSADIIAAAKVDGCSDIELFWYIGLPLAQNIIGVLGFTNFAALWSNFFSAQLFIDSSKFKSLPAGIAAIVYQCGGILPVANRCIMNPEGHTISRAEIALLGVISTLPVLIIFALAQRMVVRGMTAGAIKE